MELTDITYPNAVVSVTGKLLHGEKWQRKLAADLGVNERQIRRWMAADAILDPSSPVFVDLIRLLEKKIEELHGFYNVVIPWHAVALAEARVYDTAAHLNSIDEVVSGLSFKSFCHLMKQYVKASELGVTKEQFERALQGAWEKVHI